MVYILSKRRVVRSGDIHFPKSTNSEGVQSSPTPAPPTTLASPPPPPAITTTTSTEPVTQSIAVIPYPKFPSTENWQRWCNRNLLQATQWWIDGYPDVKKAWNPRQHPIACKYRVYTDPTTKRKRVTEDIDTPPQVIETSDIISPPPQQEPNTTPTPQQSSHQPNPSPTLAIAPPLPPPNRDDYSILSSYHSDIYGPNAIIQPQAVPPQPQQVTTCYGRTIRAPCRYLESGIDQDHRSNQYPEYLYDHDVHMLPAINDS